MNDEANRERLEMAGYESGRRGDAVCYRGSEWTTEEADSYRRGWKAGRNVRRPRQTFREEDCSGSFDGFTVTSDADPGL